MKPTIDLQSLVDSHEQPFMFIDKDFKVVALNQVYQQIYHIDSDRTVSRPCYEVSHGLSRPCFEIGWEATKAGRPKSWASVPVRCTER